MDKLHLVKNKNYTKNLLSLDLDEYELENQIYKYLLNDNQKPPWEDDEFSEHKQIIEDENEYIQNPIKIEYNSLIKCNKCNQNKVHTYSKQTRSCDESTTVFCTCLNCNCSWTL